MRLRLRTGFRRGVTGFRRGVAAVLVLCVTAVFGLRRN